MSIPFALKACIRIGVPARDWHKVEDSVAERYEKILAKDGEIAARRWARREAPWFLLELGKRLVSPAAWMTAFRSFLG